MYKVYSAVDQSNKQSNNSNQSIIILSSFYWLHGGKLGALFRLVQS